MKKVSNLQMKISGHLFCHVRQFRPETAQGVLQFQCLILHLVQLIILCHIRQKSAAHEIHGAPALCAVQIFYHFPGDRESLFSGAHRLRQFSLLIFHSGDILLIFQNPSRLRCPGRLDRLRFFPKHVLISALTIPQISEPSLAVRNLTLQSLKLPFRRVIFYRSGVSFSLLLRQLLPQLAGYSVKKSFQASSVQLVHVFLLFPFLFLQLRSLSLQFRFLRPKIFKFYFHTLFLHHFLLKLLQITVIVFHFLCTPLPTADNRPSAVICYYSIPAMSCHSLCNSFDSLNSFSIRRTIMVYYFC